MLKKMGFIALGALALLNGYATPNTIHAIQPGITLEYDLPPQEGQIFVNYMFWSIEATCKMVTEDDSDEVLIEGIARQGKVNGVPLHQGESMQLNIHSGELLKLNADSGAKVKITNFGQHVLKATCSA